jgi:hypothetical protein
MALFNPIAFHSYFMRAEDDRDLRFRVYFWITRVAADNISGRDADLILARAWGEERNLCGSNRT